MSGYQDFGEMVISLLTAVTVRLLFRCMSCFSSLISLPDYDMMLIVSKGPAHLTARRYKAKNGYAGLFQFSDNAGREEVF